MYCYDKIIFMEVRVICEPTTSVADWSSPLLGTYPIVRKALRPEVGTLLTTLATGSGDMGYSAPKLEMRPLNLCKSWVSHLKNSLIL